MFALETEDKISGSGKNSEKIEFPRFTFEKPALSLLKSTNSGHAGQFGGWFEDPTRNPHKVEQEVCVSCVANVFSQNNQPARSFQLH